MCVVSHRFWCIKYLIVIGIITAFFFIPTGDDYIFSKGEC